MIYKVALSSGADFSQSTTACNIDHSFITPSHRRPTSLGSLLALKAKHPAAKLVVGNTEVGIEMKFKNAVYPHLVGTTHVAELNQVKPSRILSLAAAAFPRSRRS